MRLMTLVVLLALCVAVFGLAACGDDVGGGDGGTDTDADTDTDTDADADTDTDTDTDTDGDGGTGETCGDFTVTPLQWSWEWFYEDAGVYMFSTLLEVDQGNGCMVFDGYWEHDVLVLSWNEGDSIECRRTEDTTPGSGFGPRECIGATCVIGDVFQSDFVYEGFPDNDELQALIASYGLPDEVCGYVSNADLIEHSYCAALAEDE